MAEHRERVVNPALSPLAILVGEWQTALSNSSFLPDRSATLRGHTSFRWVEEGAFLAMHQSETPLGPPDAVWIIGRDEAKAEYEVLYFDTRPMSRVYHMTLEGKVWKMWREAPGFWQRFECSVGNTNRTMKGYWETSTDNGRTWQHDFDISYSKD